MRAEDKEKLAELATGYARARIALERAAGTRDHAPPSPPLSVDDLHILESAARTAWIDLRKFLYSYIPEDGE